MKKIARYLRSLKRAHKWSKKYHPELWESEVNKAELDNQIVEKKIAKMSSADVAFLLESQTDGYLSDIHVRKKYRDEVIKSALDLSIIKKIAKVPGGINWANGSTFGYQFTEWGKLIQKKLKAKQNTVAAYS